MAQLPSALLCQVARPSMTFWPKVCTAKSIIVVVPPHAAARVPVSKVSDAAVPPNGSSMWVCASTPPGITYLPVASMTRSTVLARSLPSSTEPGASTPTMVSPSIRTSAALRPVAVTTVPPVMSVVVMVPPSPCRSRADDRGRTATSCVPHGSHRGRCRARQSRSGPGWRHLRHSFRAGRRSTSCRRT